MWLEKSGPAMHVMHLGFPIGATLAPLIAYKFLSEENVTDPMTTPVYEYTPAYQNVGHQSEDINELKPSRIEIRTIWHHRWLCLPYLFAFACYILVRNVQRLV